MMKISTIIFTYFLTSLILFNSTRVTINYTYYNLDPVSFIETFCENLDKPELKCNGKCHLSKIAKTQDKDQKTPESVVDFKELILFTNTFEPVTFQQKTHLKKPNLTAYQNLYSYNSIYDCFHPPQV
ncbi:hypothetical protein WNY78_10115 [Psychroserpens sp. AS72]|uniref:hypothetical protein n=1 Tax=Psychroserpens sp. AS72 TaxID=3135775 RepID=UPI00316CD5A1